jgi:predicted DNA-binding transcriptional regulator YafY
MFSSDEIEALLLGSGMVARAADPALAKAAQNAFAKITAVLPANRSSEIEASGLLAGPIKPAVVDRVNLAPLRSAIRAEQKIWIAYRDHDGSETERRIWPITITYCARVRLLAAWCELRESYRHFRTDRIAELAEVGERYPRRRHALIKEWRELEGLP